MAAVLACGEGALLSHRSAGELGALRIGLRPGRAALSFVAQDGTTLDRSTVTCRQS
jgi:hypothetical protein